VRYGVIVLLAVAAAVVVPSMGAAQGLPSFQGWDGYYLGGAQIVPSVKVGYQRMAINMNLPVPYSPLSGFLFSQSGLDLKLRETGFWTGEVRLDARRNGIGLFAAAQGLTRRSADVLTSSEPFWAGGHPVSWRGSRIEGWTLEGGGSVDVWNDLALVAGFRAEHLSFNLTGPNDPTGLIGDYHGVYGDRYSGDLQIKFQEPYIGLRVGGLNYTGTLIFSPYMWTNVKIPFRYFTVWIPSVDYYYEDARYLYKRNGFLLEGNFDYRVRTTSDFGCEIWLKGKWCQIRGGGNEDYRFEETVLGNSVFSYATSNSAAGSLTSYVLAGGLAFLYAF
jgi:hypothetical protein